jgi:hypothetical protein
LPVVKIGEPDPVGEIQDGDKGRHALESVTRACLPALIKTVSRTVGY